MKLFFASLIIFLHVTLILGIHIRGTSRRDSVSAPFKKFWHDVIEPVIPSMIELHLKGPTTLSSCDGSTTGAYNSQCWYDRYNWITSQNGMADLLTLAVRVGSASATLNQSSTIFNSVALPQVNSDLPNSLALAIGDLSSATSPAISTVTQGVQTALATASSMTTSLGQTFNTTVANLWGQVSSQLAQAGQIDASNINSLIAIANSQNGLSSALTPLSNLTQLITVTAPNAITKDSAGLAQLVNSIDLMSDSIPAVVSTGTVNLTSNISSIQNVLNQNILALSNSFTNTTRTTYANSLKQIPGRLNTTNSSIMSTINSWSNATNISIVQSWLLSQAQFANITSQLKSANTSMTNLYNQIVNASTATLNASNSSSSSATIKALYSALQANASSGSALA